MKGQGGDPELHPKHSSVLLISRRNVIGLDEIGFINAKCFKVDYLSFFFFSLFIFQQRNQIEEKKRKNGVYMIYYC